MPTREAVPALPAWTSVLARFWSVAALQAFPVHAVGHRVRVVADRDEEHDQEQRRRDPLQRRHVSVQQHHPDNKHRAEDHRPFCRPLPGGRIDGALAGAPRRTVVAGTRARTGVGLPRVLVRAEVARIHRNLVPLVVEVDVLVLVAARLLLPPALFLRWTPTYGH